MTCIAGIVHDGIVYIGGDSAGVEGYQISRRADTKVFVNGPYAIGFTSSFRMGQLLQHSFKPPIPTSKEIDNLEKFMVTRFVDSVRDCFQAGGFAKVQDSQEEGGVFLVGIHSRLFSIEEDYQVGEVIDTYDAIGAGAAVAKGALFALSDTTKAPKDKLLIALEASERWCNAVSAPFNIVSTPALKAQKKKKKY